MEAIDKRLNVKTQANKDLTDNNNNNEDFKNLGSSSETDEETDIMDSKEYDSNIEESTATKSNINVIASKKDVKRKDSKSRGETKEKRKKIEKQKIIFNVSDTKYDVVKFVGKKLFKWKLSYDPDGEWDIFWTDNAVQIETLAKMQPFQKINHFPGMYSLARKNHLGRNLMRMKRSFPDNYKFFPPTWLLPAEYNDFKMQFTKKKNKTFIIKPEASCQGRGIFLTRTYESINPSDHYVAQRYIHKPYLIEGLKFDLRIYVLLAGCDPLKIFLYYEGLARFATEEYISPTQDNLDKVCMHLTNYAINKDNPNFIFNEDADVDDVGHKRSLTSVFNFLESEGHDINKLWKEIKKIIIKTFCSVQPILSHSYKSCQPEEPYNNMCFELLGFDIMLDHKLKPWLIEVNHTPSFTTDTPLDRNIKKNVIKDSLVLMNISPDHKIKYKNKKKQEMQKRVLTGKKIKITPEEKQSMFEAAQKERNAYEAKNLGGFTKIYPFDDSEPWEDYEEFQKMAHKWWEEWTGTTVKKNPKKIERITTPSSSSSTATTTTTTGNPIPPPMTFGISGGPLRANKPATTIIKDNNTISSHKLKPPSNPPSKPPSQQGSRKQTTIGNSGIGAGNTSINHPNAQDNQSGLTNFITSPSHASLNSKSTTGVSGLNHQGIINYSNDFFREDEDSKTDDIIAFARNLDREEDEYERDFIKHVQAISNHNVIGEDDTPIICGSKLLKKDMNIINKPRSVVLNQPIQESSIKQKQNQIPRGQRGKSQNVGGSSKPSSANTMINKDHENDDKSLFTKKLLHYQQQEQQQHSQQSDKYHDINIIMNKSSNNTSLNDQSQNNHHPLDIISDPIQAIVDLNRPISQGYAKVYTRKQEERNNNNSQKISPSLFIKPTPSGNFIQPKLMEFKLNNGSRGGVGGNGGNSIGISNASVDDDTKNLIIGGNSISMSKARNLPQANIMNSGQAITAVTSSLNTATAIGYTQKSSSSLNKNQSGSSSNLIITCLR